MGTQVVTHYMSAMLCSNDSLMFS